MNANLLAHNDMLQRVGAELLAAYRVQDALAEVGNVYPCGSYFLGLTLRPEIDFLLLVDTANHQALAAVQSVLSQQLRTNMVTILERSGGLYPAPKKHFVVAKVHWPRDAPSVEPEEWTIDVAVWTSRRWRALHGEPRPPQLDRPLTPSERVLVLRHKAAAARSGAVKIDTRRLAEQVQRGEMPLASPSDETRQAERNTAT